MNDSSNTSDTSRVKNLFSLLIHNRLFIFLTWSIIFTAIYTQSPLFTSNQNQYFLHGLAQAGYGLLDQDWLANTADPTPVFSWFVFLTHRFFGTNLLFYIYFSLLLGIYLFSLVEIMREIFQFQKNYEILIFITLFLLIHSAAWRYMFSRLVGLEANYLFEGGVAGQRVLGSVLQPSAFGVLLIFSVYLFLKNKITMAVISLAIAATIHPTYLFSSAILVFSYSLVIYIDEKAIWKSVRAAAMALVLVLPILYYVVRNFVVFQGENAIRAYTILANYRLSHHTLVDEWFDWTTIVQIVLITVAMIFVRRTKLFWILLIGTLSALLATLLVIFSQSKALALMFPWRISTILVPLAVAMILARGVRYLIQTRSEYLGKNNRSLIWICLGVIGLLIAIGLIRFSIEYQMKRQVLENGIYQFARTNQSTREIYLIPPKMQDFRLETGAPVYVDSKSIPYREDEVLEWYRRLQYANSAYYSDSFDCRILNRFRRLEGVTRVVIPTNGEELSCDFLIEDYRDKYYRVYRFIE